MEKEKLDLKSKKLLCWDNGLFISMCARLARDFGTVYYYSPWESAFPSKKQTMIGEGIEGIARVNDFFDYVDEADCIFFPDIYQSSLQLYLEGLGKPVFGSRRGDELELLRAESKELFKELGLPVNKYEVIIGLENLRKHLMKVDNKYIKVSTFRGDAETFFHKNFRLTEPMLDEMETKLGVMQNDYEFIVEDAIDGKDIVETGYDGFCVDGQFPDKCVTGYEIKDLGYAGCVRNYKDISPLIKGYNDKMADTLKQYRYRNFFSTEIRVGKNKIPYQIDQCARLGSPPNELYQEMIVNLGEVIWYGAQGIMKQPEYIAKFGIEIMIHSDWADKNWQAVYYPEKISQWVKLRNACKIGDTYYVVPQDSGLPEIGSVVAIGNTMDECLKKVAEYAEQIEGHRIDIKMGSVDEINKAVSSGEALGIKFG